MSKPKIDNKRTTEIDYMHPDGKPLPSIEQMDQERKPFDGRELEAESLRQKALDISTDGHHMCSNKCHHPKDKSTPPKATSRKSAP